MLQCTGEDCSLCPTCKSGKMERVARYLNQHGTMVNIKDLHRKRTINKASPQLLKAGNATGL